MNKKIYPDGYAALLVGRAGQKYLSYNRTEELVFFETWCGSCKFSAHCTIGARDSSLCIKGDDAEEFCVFQYGEDGQPCCVMFEEE